jgi:UDP-N-acetylmuramate dehydrogenase
LQTAIERRPDQASLAAELEVVSRSPVYAQAPLTQFSRWRIGGPADYLVDLRSGPAVPDTLAWLNARGIPVIVIGDGSNILFDDAGFRGVVLRIGRALHRLEIRGTAVTAEAGHFVPRFVHAVASAGLAGAEHAIGIPGTLGGLVAMNGGSRRKGIGENLTRVRGCTLTGIPFELSQAECKFRYRNSVLLETGAVVIESDFEFTPGDKAAMRKDMLSIMRERRAKFPQRLPNCGSVFVSDPAMYATVGPPGKAIEETGLKGVRRGGAQISPLHANFIVNVGNATSADVLGLIALIRQSVFDRTGFHLQCEVRHISPEGVVRPAHLAAEEAGA